MGRPVGAVSAKAPAEGSGECSEAVAMASEPLRITIANALDPADDDLVLLFDTLEPHSSVKRQVFFRGIDNLQQMALEPRRRKARDCSVDDVEGGQEIADQRQLRGARQRLED